MRTIVYALAVAAAVAVSPVRACGHCVEDKIAAVYDYAVLSGAQAARRHVAFLAIDGKLVNDAKLRRTITDTVGATAGVDRASVRVSLDLGALSFAFDPRRASLGAIERGLGQRLAPLGLRLTEMKVFDDSAAWPATAKR